MHRLRNCSSLITHLSSMDCHSSADPEEPKEVSTQLANRRGGERNKSSPLPPIPVQIFGILARLSSTHSIRKERMVGLEGVDNSRVKGHNRLVPQCGMTEDRAVHERNSISPLAIITPPVAVGNLRNVPP
jgi:hypothetical protein